MKILFRLSIDEYGYPPISVESTWGEAASGSGVFTLDSIPFFAKDAAYGDAVSVLTDSDGTWFSHVERRSGNSLIRIALEDSINFGVVSSLLIESGCQFEYAKQYLLFAVSVPKATSLVRFRCALDVMVAKGLIDYEEALLVNG